MNLKKLIKNLLKKKYVILLLLLVVVVLFLQQNKIDNDIKIEIDVKSVKSDTEKTVEKSNIDRNVDVSDDVKETEEPEKKIPSVQEVKPAEVKTHPALIEKFTMNAIVDNRVQKDINGLLQPHPYSGHSYYTLETASEPVEKKEDCCNLEEGNTECALSSQIINNLKE